MQQPFSKTIQKPASSPCLFSIIIPTLNEQKYLPWLLKDLSKQTNQSFEVIIVDAQSRDKTVQKAQSFQNTISLTIISSPEKNVCLQRNLGANKAKGEWLIFMDADNRIPPYYLRGLQYQIEKNLPQVFTTHIAPDGNHPLNKTIAQVINTTFQTQKKSHRPAILEAMFCIQAKIFQKSSGFDKNIKWGEGTALISKLSKKGYVYSVFKEPTYTYSLRRVKKEGTIKIVRKLAPLLLAHQTGIKLEDRFIQKLYPMLGGNFFDTKTHPTNSFELIIKELSSHYDIPKKIAQIKKPLKTHSKNLQDLVKKIFS